MGNKLDSINKKLGMKKTYDPRGSKMGATEFSLTIHAVVMDDEKDNMSEENLLKMLHIRFRDHLYFVFDEDQIAGKYEELEKANGTSKNT